MINKIQKLKSNRKHDRHCMSCRIYLFVIQEYLVKKKKNRKEETLEINLKCYNFYISVKHVIRSSHFHFLQILEADLMPATLLKR